MHFMSIKYIKYFFELQGIAQMKQESKSFPWYRECNNKFFFQLNIT